MLAIGDESGQSMQVVNWMAIVRPLLSRLKRYWGKTGMQEQKEAQVPDRREYTLMLVPHQDEAIVRLRVPIQAFKVAAAALGVVVLVAAGFTVKYHYTVNAAASEQSELMRLRELTQNQYAQLEQLAQKTATLQEDVGRLNQLDVEIRRMVDGEGAQVSRSGGSRARYDGQGGVVAKPNADQLNTLVEELQAAAKIREQSLLELKKKVAAHNARLAVTPSIWPTNGDVTSRFGWRNSPFGWGNDWHPGIDIANSQGTAIMATADGQVVMSGWYGGYGKCVQIDHGNGIVTLYGHNSQLDVAVGQWVKKGEVIAYMGNTGASTGSHLHYEVRVNGTAVNPAKFL